jgi:predicted nucleic acid-binding protein
MVFVDTGAWFAKFVPDDPNHQRVQSWFDSTQEPLITTDYCIDETLTLLVARRRWQRALIAGKALFNPNVTAIHFITKPQVERGWILFQQRGASGWSFTDCTSKVVIDDLGICTAAALDIHFRQIPNIAIVP